MLPAAAAPTSRTVATHERPLDQPSAYSPIPQRLIADLHDSPLAIGLYGLIARLYLVAQSPIPLSAPDVLRYDPALSRGAVLRALARLLAAGYLIESTQTGCKTRYTPAWGRIGGSPLAWNMARPCLGRPRHIASLRLDRRLLDICMGKLTPHATRAAVITRYVTAPILSLTDVGCYALTMAGLPHATPALVRLGAVREGHVQPLPSDQRLLALISQRALDLDQHPDVCVELTSSGTRRMGLQPLLAPDSAASTTQPLFFVPPHMIGMLIHPVIGPMIGSDASAVSQTTAAVSDESGRDTNREGITWESRDLPDEATPPQPPHMLRVVVQEPPIRARVRLNREATLYRFLTRRARPCCERSTSNQLRSPSWRTCRWQASKERSRMGVRARLCAIWRVGWSACCERTATTAGRSCRQPRRLTLPRRCEKPLPATLPSGTSRGKRSRAIGNY